MVDCYLESDVSPPVIWKRKDMLIDIQNSNGSKHFFLLLWSFEWFVDCHKTFLNPFLSRTAVWVFIIILLVFCWAENIIVISIIVTALHLCTPNLTTIPSHSLLLVRILPSPARLTNNQRASLMPPKVTGGLTPAHYKDRNQFGGIRPIFYPALS